MKSGCSPPRRAPPGSRPRSASTSKPRKPAAPALEACSVSQRRDAATLALAALVGRECRPPLGPPAAWSTVAVGRSVGVKLLAVCVSRRWLRCGWFACRLAVVRGSLPVVGGSLAVEHCGHPVACGLAALVSVRTAIVPASEFLTDAGAYVALDGCSIAVDGLSIAVVGCALARVSVVIRVGDRAHIRPDSKASDRRASACSVRAGVSALRARASRRCWPAAAIARALRSGARPPRA